MAEDFNTLYKEFRNRLRPYRAQEIVREALQATHRASGNRPEHLRHAPWQVMLMVKWALQDRMVSDRTGRRMTREEFDQLRQSLYELVDRSGPVKGISLPLFVRRLMHQQVAFQKSVSAAFIREAALLMQLDAGHTLSRLFQRQVGLSPDLFIDLSLAAYAAIINGSLILHVSTFDNVSKCYGSAAVDRFLGLVSRDFEGLRAFCRQLPNAGTPVASEMLEFTPLRRIPFLKEGNKLACWHPMVFYRGMEDFVHLTLSEAGSAYIEPFSKLFEQHVRAEVLAGAPQALFEEDLRKLVPAQTQTPDALMMYPGTNIFVEAKAGLFDDSVMVVGNEAILSHKTKALRHAIRQGWDAAVALRESDSAPRAISDATTDYLLVVTNRELATSNGIRLREMYPEGKLEYPSKEAQSRLPLERVYVLAIDDFERVINAIKFHDLDLPTFLASCVERDRAPATGKFYFDQHLAAEAVPYGRSELLSAAIHQASERLEAALQQ